MNSLTAVTSQNISKIAQRIIYICIVELKLLAFYRDFFVFIVDTIIFYKFAVSYLYALFNGFCKTLGCDA